MYERHKKLLKNCFEVVRNSTALVSGIGGLGSTVSVLLTRTGFKKLYLVDYKRVDEPDLNRQILYDFSDLGRLKTEVAKYKLKKIRKDLEVVVINEKIDENFDIPNDVNIVFDCLDNFKARYMLQEAAFKSGAIFVHGGVKGFSGQVGVFTKKHGRLKEIFGELEDDESPIQVLPSIVTVVASIQVSEAIKVLCGVEALVGKLLLIDLYDNSFELIDLSF